MPNLLPLDWIASAALSLCVGWLRSKSWKARLALSVAIGLIGWAASYPLTIIGAGLGYDAALSEDYVNGFSARNALVEMGVAILWSLLWLGIGVITALSWRRVATRRSSSAPPN
jgi:hypothetical protein